MHFREFDLMFGRNQGSSRFVRPNRLDTQHWTFQRIIHLVTCFPFLRVLFGRSLAMHCATLSQENIVEVWKGKDVVLSSPATPEFEFLLQYAAFCTVRNNVATFVEDLRPNGSWCIRDKTLATEGLRRLAE